MADRTIEIIIETNDKTGGSLDAIKAGLLAMDKAAQRMQNRLRSIANQKYAATLRLIDRVTEPGSRINSFLKNMTSRVYNLTMRLNDTAFGKIRQIEASLMRIAGRAWTIGINLRDNVSGKLRGLADGMLMGAGAMGVGMAGTAGIGYSAYSALNSYIDFQKQMSRVQAVAAIQNKNDPTMIALTEKAKEMGATTEWTRSEAAQAEYYMAMAGWSPDRIIKALPSVMNLASAGGTDLATTSDIVTDAMTGFGLKAGEMYINKFGRAVEASEHFADIMAKTVTSSNTNISQLGEAMKYSSNVIGAMYNGKDIQTRMRATEDALTMTGLMANAGIKGSMAGTATRAIFSRFGSENRNAYNALRAMNVDFTDKETGEVRAVGDVMRDLSKRFKEGVDPNELLNFAEAIGGEKIHADTRRKLESFIAQTQKHGGKMTGADMLKMSSMLAGQEAMSGLMAVLLGDWDELNGKIQNADGSAKQMADTMLDNLGGSLKILGSAWDAFTQDLFEGKAGEGIRGFVDTLTEVISRAQKLFSDGIQIGDFGKIIGDIVGRLKNKFLELDGIGSILAGGVLMAGLIKIGRTIQKVIGYFGQLKALEIGARLGSPTTPPTRTGLPIGQSVGTMTVNAGVVNINGRVSGGTSTTATNRGTSTTSTVGGAAVNKVGNVGNTGIISNYEQTKARIRAGIPPATTTSPVASRFSGMRSAAGGAALFAGIFGALDFYNTRSMSQERSAAALEEIALAKKSYEEQLQQGASQDILTAEAKKIAEAQAAHTRILKENADAELRTGAGAIGMVAGTALGAALGSLVGPVGSIVGGMVGGMIGQKFGDFVAERHINNGGSNTVEAKLNDKAVDMIITAKLTDNFQKHNPNTPLDESIFGRRPPKPDNIFTGIMPKSFDDFVKITPPTTTAPTQNNAPSMADFRRMQDVDPYEKAIKTFEADTQRIKESIVNDKFNRASQFRSDQFVTGNDAAFDYYKRQRENMTAPPEFDFWSRFDNLFGVQKAHASELNAEQLAQQAAMERGEMPTGGEIPTGKLPESGKLDTESLGENLYSQLEGLQEGIGELFTNLGESITENLTSTFEGVGELFSTFGESITENLTSTFEGVGELFSTFGESITENLTSTFESVGEVFSTFGESITENLTASFESVTEIFGTLGESINEGLASMMSGADEIFSGFGELVASGLETANSAATSALENISASFESAKSSIESAWGELPGFFDGVFSGLGGAAEAAGSAIYSGLTSVIGAVIGAWESAAATVSGIISSISSMASSVAGMVPSFGGGVGKAEGGFVSSETHFFAGEHGPEVVIPLSSSRRARALDLFEKTAAILGGDAISFGADEISDDERFSELSDNFAMPTRNLESNSDDSGTFTTSESGNNSVSLGGVNISFEINGLENSQEIVEAIKENIAEITDRIAAQLSVKIGDVHHNQNLAT